MKKNILLTYLVFLLSFVNLELRASESDVDGDKIVYAIQLMSFSKYKKDFALEFLNNLDKNIQAQTALYFNGKFISLRYKSSINKELLFDDLKRMREIGFKDA